MMKMDVRELGVSIKSTNCACGCSTEKDLKE